MATLIWMAMMVDLSPQTSLPKEELEDTAEARKD